MSIYEKEVSGSTVNFREVDATTLGNYVLKLAGENGTLTDEQYTKLVNGFPNVLITLNDVYALKPERVIDGKYYFQMVEVDEDENGKFVGDINVIVNADKTWQYGEFYIDVPQGAGGVTIEISQAGASGTLSSDDLDLIINNFPNVNIRQLGRTIYAPLEFDSTTNHYKFVNVFTTDTQANTRIISVSGSTGQWTFTQYLTDLGGGGLTWRKVTVSELQSLLNTSVGKLVKIVCKKYHYSTIMFTSNIPALTVQYARSGVVAVKYQQLASLSSASSSFSLRNFTLSINGDGGFYFGYGDYLLDYANSTVTYSAGQEMNSGAFEAYYDIYIEE